MNFRLSLLLFLGLPYPSLQATTLWQGVVGANGSVSKFNRLEGGTHSSKVPVVLAVYVAELQRGESLAVSAFAVGKDATKVAIDVFEDQNGTKGRAWVSDKGATVFPFDFPLALVRLSSDENAKRYWIEIRAHAQQLGGYKIE